MNRQALHIGEPLVLPVRWIDRVPVPEKVIDYQGEVIGWRTSQIIIRVKGYNAVVRFWKKSGLEVGNKDHERRGLYIDPKELEVDAQIRSGVAIDFDAIRAAIDGEEAAQVASIEGNHESVSVL